MIEKNLCRSKKKEDFMKKRIVIMLAVLTIILSGCKSREEQIEVSLKENVQTESVQTESVQTENVQTESVQTESPQVEEQDKKVEVIAENTKENVYEAQMNLVYEALEQEWSIDKYFDNQISSLISYHYEGNALDNVGYAFKDLDGDEKDELLISAVSEDYSSGMLYDVYTTLNGEVQHVLSGHDRNRYYLQWLEEGTYMIANEASNSAYNFACYYYTLMDGKLELMQGVVFNALEDEENPWFLTYDEDWDASNDTHDVEGVAESIIDANRKIYTTLDYTPFSAYKF